MEENGEGGLFSVFLPAPGPDSWLSLSCTVNLQQHHLLGDWHWHRGNGYYERSGFIHPLSLSSFSALSSGLPTSKYKATSCRECIALLPTACEELSKTLEQRAWFAIWKDQLLMFVWGILLFSLFPQCTATLSDCITLCLFRSSFVSLFYLLFPTFFYPFHCSDIFILYPQYEKNKQFFLSFSRFFSLWRSDGGGAQLCSTRLVNRRCVCHLAAAADTAHPLLHQEE